MSADAENERLRLEELLRSGSEAFLSRHGADQLKSMSQLKSNGAFLMLYESEDALRMTLNSCADASPVTATVAPGKFQFIPSEGVAFLYQQMGLAPPPAVAFDAQTQCVVVAVVCLSSPEAEVGEGAIYQNIFVYTY